eukprot:767520-Hanusia_phi.AAC.3
MTGQWKHISDLRFHRDLGKVLPNPTPCSFSHDVHFPLSYDLIPCFSSSSSLLVSSLPLLPSHHPHISISLSPDKFPTPPPWGTIVSVFGEAYAAKMLHEGKWWMKKLAGEEARTERQEGGRGEDNAAGRTVGNKRRIV